MTDEELVQKVLGQLPEFGRGHSNALFRRGAEWALRAFIKAKAESEVEEVSEM